MRAALDALRDEGLKPGEGVRAMLDGPEQPSLLEEMEQRADAARGGVSPTGWAGKGRKPGSKNVATKEVVEYVRARGVDPLLWAMQQLTSAPGDLRAVYGGSLKAEQVMQHQRWAAEFLAKYLHPQSLLEQLLGDRDQGTAVAGFLAMASLRPGMAGAAAPTLAEGMSRDQIAERVPLEVEVEENQGLEACDDGKVAQGEGRTDG